MLFLDVIPDPSVTVPVRPVRSGVRVVRNDWVSLPAIYALHELDEVLHADPLANASTFSISAHGSSL